MTSRRLALALGLLSTAACSGSADRGAASAHPSAPPAIVAASASAVAVTNAPSASAAAAAPPAASASGPGLGWLALASPPPANTSCRAVAKGSGVAATVARAVQRLACEPALYYRSTSELRTELALPADVELTFLGPTRVGVAFPETSAAAFAAALHLDEPVGLRGNSGAWGWRRFDLVTDKKAHRIAGLGPGTIDAELEIRGLDVADDVNEVALGELRLSSPVRVAMPASVLPLADDETARARLMAGLEQIAKDKRLLAADPAEVARVAGLDGDAFSVSRWESSSSTGAKERGLDVFVRRTQIGAGSLIARMDLTGRIEHSRAHDSDEVLLYDGDRETQSWRGLRVTLRFAERDGAPADGIYGKHVLAGVHLAP